jgi:hypothetical protein
MYSLLPLFKAAGASLLLAGLPRSSGAAVAAARRPLSTDRPDATKSPYTVEPGHVQLEMDFANYGTDRVSGVRFSEWEAVPFNLRFGLAPDFEAGFFVVPYRRETVKQAPGPSVRTAGFGDLTARAKLNLIGNDGGGAGFGVIADLKLPTGSGELGNGKFEDALIVPVAFSLSGGWSGGALTSVGQIHAGGYQTTCLNTVTFAHEVAPDVGGFLELTSYTAVGSHLMIFNCGLTRAVGRDTQFDYGLSVGTSRNAPDFGVFAGLARRM